MNANGLRRAFMLAVGATELRHPPLSASSSLSLDGGLLLPPLAENRTPSWARESSSTLEKDPNALTCNLASFDG